MTNMSAPSRRARETEPEPAGFPWTGWALIGLLLFAVIWYVWSYQRDTPAGVSSRPSASTSASCSVRPGDVRVSVYNGNGKDKLARQVADQLKTRGFTIGKVGNTKTYSGAAAVRHRSGATGRGAAELVSSQMSGATLSTKDSLSSTSVELVLGKTFGGLGPAVTSTPNC